MWVVILLLAGLESTQGGVGQLLRPERPKPPISRPVIPPVEQPIKLASYNIYKDFVTLSGFSSGGTFAQQLQISYSSLFSGIAVFSHTYYGCGPGNGLEKDYDDVCTTLGNLPNNQLWDPHLSRLAIQRYTQEGLIENPTNLQGKKLYVYTGTQNWLFTTDMSLRILNIYEPLIRDPSAIFTRIQASNLTLPSDTYGGSCSQDSSQKFFISNCGLSGPFEALKFLLGNVIRKPDSRRPVRLQPLLTFDQREFFGNTTRDIGMDTLGFIYIPQFCRTNRCYLHFYFHGCSLGREVVQDNHIRNSGYLELAEENGIIMVFPQAVRLLPENEIGCWDTYGLYGRLFATQQGVQVSAVRNMIRRIMTSGYSPREPLVPDDRQKPISSSGTPIAGRKSSYHNPFRYTHKNRRNNGWNHNNGGGIPRYQYQLHRFTRSWENSQNEEDRVSNIFGSNPEYLKILIIQLTPILYWQ